MPQFDSYPQTFTLNATDSFLVSQGDGVKRIEFDDLVTEIGAANEGALPTQVINADSVLSAASHGQVVVNSGGPVTLTLPLAGGNAGIPFWIVNKGSGVTTILASGSDTIDGVSSATLSQYQKGIFVSDSSNLWTRYGA